MGQKLLLLALAGGAGTLSRYGIVTLVQRLAGPEFPWGTMTANLTGCLLAGLFWGFAQHRVSVSPEVRTIVLLGFMGAFTTFSAYVLETGNLMRDAEWFRAFANMTLQNAVGLALMFLGVSMGRLI